MNTPKGPTEDLDDTNPDSLDIEIEFEEPNPEQEQKRPLPTFEDAMKRLKAQLDKLRKEGKIK